MSSSNQISITSCYFIEISFQFHKRVQMMQYTVKTWKLKAPTAFVDSILIESRFCKSTIFMLLLTKKNIYIYIFLYSFSGEKRSGRLVKSYTSVESYFTLYKYKHHVFTYLQSSKKLTYVSLRNSQRCGEPLTADKTPVL